MSKSRIPEPQVSRAGRTALGARGLRRPRRAVRASARPPDSGVDAPAAIDARGQRLAALGDVALQALDVGRHALEALRQRLDALVAGGARRLDADRLANGVGE